ncbi:MAG: hypothetical protein FJX75_20815 [Armatimonadetes bacterium]|nr:hypothetical protein [Armatimonadota bacterium]
MGQSGQTLKCPHCGAENPRSLLITMCGACKRNLSAAAGSPPPAAPARPPTVAGRAAPPPGVRKPQMPPTPTTPARGTQPTGYRATAPAAPQPIARPDAPAKPENAAVSCLIVLFALAAFGIAMGIVMSISK